MKRGSNKGSLLRRNQCPGSSRHCASALEVERKRAKTQGTKRSKEEERREMQHAMVGMELTQRIII